MNPGQAKLKRKMEGKNGGVVGVVEVVDAGRERRMSGRVEEDAEAITVGPAAPEAGDATGSTTKTLMVPSKTVEAVAGFSAGFCTTLLTHPLDFVKLRLQLDTTSVSQRQAVGRIYSTLVAVSTDAATGKVSAPRFLENLYRGVGPNLLGSTSAWALYFYFYRQYKNLVLHYADLDRDSSLQSWHYLLSAFAAGWTTSVLTNPIWVIKTRMISTQRTAPGAYRSVLHGLRQIYTEEGVLGYYWGLTPALFNVAQGAVQVSLYDIIKRQLVDRNNDAGDSNSDANGDASQRLTTLQYFYASSTSKMLSTGVFYPLQVVRSRLQVVNHTHRLRSVTALCADMYRREGLRAFYKGLVTNLLRVVPATCTTFLIYEKMKEHVGA